MRSFLKPVTANNSWISANIFAVISQAATPMWPGFCGKAFSARCFSSANNSDINEDCAGAVDDCHVAEARTRLVSRMAAAGRVRRKTVPAPVDEARLSSPPWARASSRAIARPSPLAPGRGGAKNGRKRVFRARGREAMAVIGALDRNRRVIARRGKAQPVRSRLDGIAGEVEEHPVELVAVGLDHEVGRDLVLDREIVLG